MPQGLRVQIPPWAQRSPLKFFAENFIAEFLVCQQAGVLRYRRSYLFFHLFIKLCYNKRMAENSNQPGPSVPPPPTREVAIRAMESDVKSIAQSGGVGATPQIFTPNLESTGVPASGAQTSVQTETPEIKAQLNVPGYTGPEQAIFKATGTVRAEQAPQESFNKWRLIFIIAGVLIVIALFWILGYFVIFPWLFPKQMPPVSVF